MARPVQFVAIFWFIFMIGGIETYKPGEIKTRFRDVWGQDPVLDKVQENIVFLEKPEEIEAKGGYVPSGILLWGPPGTGKTLMAEAVAGETGKPYVFVDPAAFMQMFIGVGIMKIKWLYRKLRKLALRYGGVVVFFDEADVARQPRRRRPPAASSTARRAHDAAARSTPATARTTSSTRPARCSGTTCPAAVDGGARIDGEARSPERGIIMGGDGHGRRRHGRAAGPAHRDVRPEEAARVLQPAACGRSCA